jgi:hypothetical protein
LLDFRTPRQLVIEAILATYPGMERKNVHVWTLGGQSRSNRIGQLWKEWKDLGVSLIDNNFRLPSGIKAFTESGTYAPVYSVGSWQDENGRTHILIVDGYAASAEAMQAASLACMFDLDASLVVFTSKFQLPYHREQDIMGLDPKARNFKARLGELLQKEPSAGQMNQYSQMIEEAANAGIPLDRRVLRADDFFPEKNWDAAALVGYMCPDPYSGAPGVEKVEENVYRTTVRLATPRGDKTITFTLRLGETSEEGRLVFNPLLIRFIYGEDFKARPVKISDSGRIRNELQTLCSEALEHTNGNLIRIHFDRIPPEVISADHQKVLREVLGWYQLNHPLWFNWLEID